MQLVSSSMFRMCFTAAMFSFLATLDASISMTSSTRHYVTISWYIYNLEEIVLRALIASRIYIILLPSVYVKIEIACTGVCDLLV